MKILLEIIGTPAELEMYVSEEDTGGELCQLNGRYLPNLKIVGTTRFTRLTDNRLIVTLVADSRGDPV